MNEQISYDNETRTKVWERESCLSGSMSTDELHVVSYFFVNYMAGKVGRWIDG